MSSKGFMRYILFFLVCLLSVQVILRYDQSTEPEQEVNQPEVSSVENEPLMTTEVKEPIKEEPIPEVIEDTPTHTEDDVYWLSMCVYKELGYIDASDDAQQKVAEVVMNRVHDTQWFSRVNTVYEVLHSPKQYGFAIRNDYTIYNQEAFNKAKANAIAVLEKSTEEYSIPDNVVFQSEYNNQGDGVYFEYSIHGTTTYFCYKER